MTKAADPTLRAAPRWREFAVFVAGGTLCALVDVGLMQLLLSVGVHYSLAASAGFGTGLLLNFAIQSRIFKTSASAGTFARFLCVIAINYGLMLACVALAAHLFDHPLAGKLLSLPITSINGYILGKRWVYR